MKLYLLVILLLNILNLTYGKVPKECEVCESVLTRLRERVPNDAKPEEIEEEFKAFCKKLSGRDEKFCYYIGGLETSATYILPEMSKPMSWNMPIDKICREKLYKKDNQICDLRYEKQINVDEVDIKKLKVKDLRKILSDWGEDCQGCTEKTDFVRKIEEIRHLYTGANAGKQKQRRHDSDF